MGNNMRDDFVVFILTHGRANQMRTDAALRNAGYTGKIVYVIDNEDETADLYYSKFGKDSVYMFNKTELANKVDSMDLSADHRAIVYARCACYDIANKLGYRYFLELDDDYANFRSRIVWGNSLKTVYIKDFDRLVDLMLEFLIESNAHIVAMSQIGDFIGGVNSKLCKDRITRKAMNALFCDATKPVTWFGRMNEDVSAYVVLGSRGYLFFTVADVSIDHLATQSLSGGMSESYADSGTYMKTFYTIMCAPSCVKLYTVGHQHPRFHHIIDWERAVPKIISDRYKKGEMYDEVSN